MLGNHVLEPTSIERAVYPFLGPARNVDTVKQAADALEKTYKEAGYATIFVDIPEQDTSSGIIRLKVTEGKLGQVHVRGERYFSRRQIVAAVPALEIGGTPNLPALQQQLTELNARTPDRAVTPVLKAGAEPGSVDVDLDVKDTLPLHGSVQYDNRHTADTTPDRATVALSYDNLWQRQDSLGVEYQTAPAKPSDAEVLSVNYMSHLGSGGLEGAFSYIHTSSDVAALGTLGVLGKGSIYGAHIIVPLAALAAGAQSINAGVDYKDVLTSVMPNTTGSASTAPVTAKVNYANWSATYSGNWWTKSQTYSLTAGLAFGVLGVINTSDEFENARYNGHPNYFYVRLGFSGTEGLPFGLAILNRFNAQWADSPLVNNEQFSLGGVDTVRGYLEAETLGDSGAAGTLELHSPSLGSHAVAVLSPLYGYVFVDGGVASLVDALQGQRERVPLWSTGLGLRLEMLHGWNAALDYALPERNGVRTLKGQKHADFSIRYGF